MDLGNLNKTLAGLEADLLKVVEKKVFPGEKLSTVADLDRTNLGIPNYDRGLLKTWFKQASAYANKHLAEQKAAALEKANEQRIRLQKQGQRDAELSAGSTTYAENRETRLQAIHKLVAVFNAKFTAFIEDDNHFDNNGFANEKMQAAKDSLFTPENEELLSDNSIKDKYTQLLKARFDRGVQSIEDQGMGAKKDRYKVYSLLLDSNLLLHNHMQLGSQSREELAKAEISEYLSALPAKRVVETLELLVNSTQAGNMPPQGRLAKAAELIDSLTNKEEVLDLMSNEIKNVTSSARRATYIAILTEGGTASESFRDLLKTKLDPEAIQKFLIFGHRSRAKHLDLLEKMMGEEAFQKLVTNTLEGTFDGMKGMDSDLSLKTKAIMIKYVVEHMPKQAADKLKAFYPKASEAEQEMVLKVFASHSPNMEISTHSGLGSMGLEAFVDIVKSEIAATERFNAKMETDPENNIPKVEASLSLAGYLKNEINRSNTDKLIIEFMARQDDALDYIPEEKQEAAFNKVGFLFLLAATLYPGISPLDRKSPEEQKRFQTNAVKFLNRQLSKKDYIKALAEIFYIQKPETEQTKASKFVDDIHAFNKELQAVA